MKLSSTTLELGCKKSVRVRYVIVLGFTKCRGVHRNFLSECTRILHRATPLSTSPRQMSVRSRLCAHLQPFAVSLESQTRPNKYDPDLASEIILYSAHRKPSRQLELELKVYPSPLGMLLVSFCVSSVVECFRKRIYMKSLASFAGNHPCFRCLQMLQGIHSRLIE